MSFFIKLQTSAYNFIKKETLAQVFSCEHFEISKKTVSTEHLRATASEGLETTTLDSSIAYIITDFQRAFGCIAEWEAVKTNATTHWCYYSETTR